MEDRSRKFHLKYLISWVILGILAGVATFILSKTPNLTLFSSLVGLVMTSVSFAGLGMLLEAWSAYNWRFGNIEHSPWVWYIYPLTVLVRIVIGVWYVVIMRNLFKK